MEDYSPMMQHYIRVKEQHPDIIIFYRLGDFYELFFEDAVLCSKVLDLTLTSKACGKAGKAEMCGVPAKACDIYLKKLIAMGYKVGICEQLTEPTKNSKEIVERDVIRIVTPGTIMEDEILEEKKNNFIACVYFNKEYYVAFSDISTGEFYITSEPTLQKLNDFLIMISPSEIICNSEMKLESLNLNAIKLNNIPDFSDIEEKEFNLKNSEDIFYKQFNTNNYKIYEINNKNELICVGALLSYLFKTQKRNLTHLNKVKYYYSKDYMYLDVNTRRNLELTASGKDNKKKGSLLWLLDDTNTAMGGRTLRSFIEQPLHNDEKINYRLNGVEELFLNISKRENIIDILKQINDLERMSSKISYGSITPRGCLTIKDSLKVIPQLKFILKNFKSEIINDIVNNIDDFEELANYLEQAIDGETATNDYKDGGFIKLGFDSVFDEYKNAKSQHKKWITALEQTEKESTGIKNLKIEYNRVFGYYIEVTNSQKELVPYRYIRKQTLTNAERYYTEELKEIEEKVLNAEEKALKREYELFDNIKQILNSHVPALQKTARSIGLLDALVSLATVAVKRDYVKPVISKKLDKIEIVDGRHPVVEALLNKGEFISNDTILDGNENRTMIITGPNMAGKSTYMRQVALITLMAHIGSFVPAREANICLTDRIFTRIGASDDLIYGQSTFMVEMTEVANILSNATNESLILLDEVGRGTATYDGLSIAWSVMDYLSKHIKAKTLFSTHYHELTELEGKLEGVKNYRITVKELNNSVIFLRKIARGGANRSFGIEVARLAGLPQELIENSKSILYSLEEKDAVKNMAANNSLPPRSAETINMLKELDLNKISPLEAFSILTNLKERL
ncbi:MAG: DNA mismatch repair protein MutS [Clostridiales bacterium]|nr:DNA mismatch repair protein MutS [Clostridiales bacterium]